MSTRAAAAWSLAWTLLGAGVAGVFALAGDGTAAGEYLTGFVIEKSLSLDNLFVFVALLSFFAIPDELRRRVLLYGIGGAVVLRGVLIIAGAAALGTFSWFTYVLGGVLALTAVKVASQRSDALDPADTLTMRTLHRLMPRATPLLAATVMVAAADVMFALDSIPAIFAVTRDPLVVFAANAFSLLGAVSLYFVLEGLLARFRHLNAGLAAILGYLAAKQLLAGAWHPPLTLTLLVIAGALGASAAASAHARRPA
jgi:tellurite resistance protein TerC